MRDKRNGQGGERVRLASLLPEGLFLGKGRDMLRFWLGREGLGFPPALSLSASEEGQRNSRSVVTARRICCHYRAFVLPLLLLRQVSLCS